MHVRLAARLNEPTDNWAPRAHAGTVSITDRTGLSIGLPTPRKTLTCTCVLKGADVTGTERELAETIRSS